MEKVEDVNRQFWGDLYQSKREQKQVCTIYDKYGSKYDELISIDKSQYNMNQEVAQMLLSVLERNSNAKIIDIACGTGLTGAALVGKGFKNIDGIEGSQGMLEVALKKNIFNQIFQLKLGDENYLQKIQAGNYDGAVSVGAICANSIKIDDFLREVTRIVRRGGCVVYTVYDTNRDQSNPVDGDIPFRFMDVHTRYMREKKIDLLFARQMPYYDMFGTNTLLAYVFVIRIK